MIQPPPWDAVTAWGIGGLAVAVALAWVRTWSRQGTGTRVRHALAVAAMLAISGVAARSGLLQRFDLVPPPMAVMIASVFAGAFAVGLSGFGRSVAETVPLTSLVGLQAFRLPLELLMHRAATLGFMPNELSYSGYNFDIVTGAVALALIAVGTSPMVRLFGSDPRHVNTWVLYFPYVWLPVVLVTIAVASHVVITRKLLLVDHR